MVQLTRTPTVQLLTILLLMSTIRPPRTIRIIRLRRWATTEQGAITAARLLAPLLLALRLAQL